MEKGRREMESVTVEFDEEAIAAIDEKAFAEHRDSREAAIRDLLDEWLTRAEDGPERGSG